MQPDGLNAILRLSAFQWNVLLVAYVVLLAIGGADMSAYIATTRSAASTTSIAVRRPG